MIRDKSKQALALLLLLSTLLLCVAGCGKREEDDTIKIVCATFPLYEWARNVVGDAARVEIVWLVRNGADLHSYQPTTADIVEMLSCDLLLYVGGESNTWVEECLENRENADRVTIDLCEAEGVTLCQISAESILSEDEHHHGHDHDHGEGEGITDEHIWLSLRNAVACSAAIANALCALDEAQASTYQANLQAYVQELNALDAAYAQTVAAATEPTLLFADRFPFVYLAEDYGIRYVAAFEGCTTEAEATPDTIIHLAKHLDEWGLAWVLTTESSDGKLARSVIQATKEKHQQVASLNSMQSVNERDAEAGATYLGIVAQNLEILRQVLHQ